MRYLCLFVVAVALAGAARGQYYYTDVLATKQTNQLYKQLRALDYKRVTATSYEGDEVLKDFVLEQFIASDGSKIFIRSATAGTSESFFTGFYQNNRLMKTVDSSNNAINTSVYTYDAAGRVASITATSADFDGKFTNSEQRTWQYNEQGLPAAMLKVKNNTDTTNVSFVFDGDQVAEERWTHRTRKIETYYYYYNNDRKLLSDIVRFNRKINSMLPDYTFEYDKAGRVTQMMQTQNGAANYLVWHYTYNENGLKQKEVVYNKQKELLGRIEYSYK